MLYTFLRDSLRFFLQHLVPLCIITVGLGVLFEGLMLVLMPMYNTQQFPWALYLLQWIGGVWTAAAVILYASAALDKRELSPTAAISGGLYWVLPLAGVQALSSIAIFSGLMLFIIPGIYFAVRFALAGFYLMLDRQPIIESLRQAWVQSTGYGWTILGGYALIYGVLFLGVQLVSVLVGVGIENYGFANALIALVFKPINALALVFGFRVFTDARNTQKGQI